MINKTLSNLIFLIEEKLKGELPGKSAHDLMMATAVNGTRLKFKSSNGAKEGAVLILLFEKNDEVHFVLTQRPNYNGTHGGQVSFPGGKREKEDVDLVQTALRETEEEIGISQASIQVIGKLSEYYVAASNHMVLPVLGFIEGEPIFEPDPHEVAEVFTSSISDLLNPSNVKVTDLEVGESKFKLRAPYFDLYDKIVWGATAGMLSEFKSLLQN